MSLLPWLALAGAVGGGLWFARARRRASTWTCRKCAKARVLLDEDTEDPYLSEAQRREEQLGAVDYQVWWCASCEDGVVVRRAPFSSRAVVCKECRSRAAKEKAYTVVPATKDRGGELRVELDCERCGHAQRFSRYTPRAS
ncbi:hypothetical protein LZ198_18490 [Myxococcus sp. K15C18031901]|uniref:hypothetical protein n=1 Tax=Myxococcus dinghuensis TaxID=2906761 RepID=UPI0020A79B3C|nr:hypothetical protein [Myxococcus dinghuensis]MCP3100863.1 hypothetical protein [Myxococcus dinghuensis]